ncbi:hypothetical protein E3983_06370 [Legionella israelensis]|uniref:Chromosome partition protein Smc n=1 Tax=Legionella israelensis TaxID=454 RepID=A0AAX1EGR3_9GAMM|nr:hypothetical protein [Legionella israelensis]QBR84009.1 hypothetical protein E3983_06370 [Legionella israelensis]
MLPSLSTVLNSLVTVIIRYHDSQRVKPLVLSRKSEDFHEKANELLKEPTDSLVGLLTNYINQCTTDINYPERKDFLMFILYQVEYLNNVLTSEESFDTKKLKDTHEHLSQLLIDARQLLNTSKGTSYTVSWGHNKTLLDGLYGTYSFCNSGTILKEELLKRLHLRITSDDEEIKQTSQSLCNDFNNMLAAKEKNVLEKKLKESEDKNQQLTLENEKLEEEKSQSEKRMEVIEKELKETKDKNQQLTLEKENLEESISSQKSESRRLSHENQQLRQENTRLKNDAPKNTSSINPLMPNLFLGNPWSKPYFLGRDIAQLEFDSDEEKKSPEQLLVD